jgi:hypothetical protein
MVAYSSPPAIARRITSGVNPRLCRKRICFRLFGQVGGRRAELSLPHLARAVEFAIKNGVGNNGVRHDI